MSRRPVLSLGAGIVAFVLAACGVPAEEQARTLGTPPFDLLTSSTTVPTATTVPPEEGFSLRLYWVTPDEQVTPGEPLGLPEAPTFQTVLNLLTEGPPVPEGTTDGSSTTTTAEGEEPAPPPLRTYITEGLKPETEGTEEALGPVVVNVDGGVLDILVADRFRDEASAQPARFRLGIAQVVCTVTQFDNVHTVRFFDSRGQLTLVNLDAITIEVATRDNIGRCDPAETESESERRSSAKRGITTSTDQARPTSTTRRSG